MFRIVAKKLAFKRGGRMDRVALFNKTSKRMSPKLCSLWLPTPPRRYAPRGSNAIVRIPKSLTSIRRDHCRQHPAQTGSVLCTEVQDKSEPSLLPGSMRTDMDTIETD